MTMSWGAIKWSAMSAEASIAVFSFMHGPQIRWVLWRTWP